MNNMSFSLDKEEAVSISFIQEAKTHPLELYGCVHVWLKRDGKLSIAISLGESGDDDLRLEVDEGLISIWHDIQKVCKRNQEVEKHQQEYRS